MNKIINRSVFRINKAVSSCISEEKGEVNLVAILLIILVTIGLVIIFRTQITNLINNIFTRINQDVNGI